MIKAASPGKKKYKAWVKNIRQGLVFIGGVDPNSDPSSTLDPSVTLDSIEVQKKIETLNYVLFT